MKRQSLVVTIGVVLIAVIGSMGLLLSAPGSAGGQGRGGAAQGSDYRLSGPYTHKNLSIFLVHGKNVIKAKSFLTLQEALVQRKVVVYETKR